MKWFKGRDRGDSTSAVEDMPSPHRRDWSWGRLPRFRDEEEAVGGAVVNDVSPNRAAADTRPADGETATPQGSGGGGGDQQDTPREGDRSDRRTGGDGV